MSNGSFSEIDVEGLAVALEAGVRLVDVRESDEYTAGHIPGALHVPLGEVPDRLQEVGGGRSTVYFVCKGGARSAHACEIVRASGVDTVNVVGGTLAWIMSGRPVVEGNSP